MTNRAAVLMRPGEIAMQQRPIPTPAPREVLVEVTSVGVFAFALPDGMSDDVGALMEPLSVGIWACRKAGITAGDRVLVTGAGPIGLLAMQVARAFGATDVAIADVNEHRLSAARRMGATRVLRAGDGATGTFRYANTYPAAIELAATGRVDVAALITGHYALEDTERALLAGREDAESIKVMVHPRATG